MKLFLDYLNKIKLQILLMLFPTILTGMIFLLYQLPMEPILYIAAVSYTHLTLPTKLEV